MFEKEKGSANSNNGHSPSEEKEAFNRGFIRAENEDDDGYDPYSDRREYTPLFEPDPWA